MGNRQGSHKTKDNKTKEEKKREKEVRKEEEKRRKKKEKDRKKKSKDGGPCPRTSLISSDWEESSQVTESESSVFHSAENISASPYLDSCTRSELEQLPLEAVPGGDYLQRWGPASSVSAYQLHYQQYHQRNLDQHGQLSPTQLHPHPIVLSSKDFKDGFSLEACIPPEIARREPLDSFTDDSMTLVRGQGYTSQGHACEGSVTSKRSNVSESNKSKSSSKSSHFASPLPYHVPLTSLPGEDSASMTSSQTSTGGGQGSYSTPLSTPVFGRIERPQSPITSQRVFGVSNTPRNQNGREPSSPQSPHHPHFFNHQRNQTHQYPYHPEADPNTWSDYAQKPKQICPIYQDISPLLIKKHEHQQQYHQHHRNQSQQSPYHQRANQRPQNIVDEETLIRQQQVQNTQQQQQIQAFQQFPQIIDYRNLPKPASPHPTRRAFSPKMTSPPFKLISSDESSSSPTTPVPQRRAAGATNILNIFRSGSKKEKKRSQERQVGKCGDECDKRGASSGERCVGKEEEESDEGRPKTKPKWKTWERSTSKNSDRLSKTIFGTVRKGERTKSTSSTERNSDVLPSDFRVNDQKFEEFINKKDSRVNSAGCRKLTLEELRRDSHNVTERKSSPPVVKSPALCIMKLEELERNIENTIREKFPDAEPFLLKKRIKDDDIKGSRSLPTTPSLKKKLYVNREREDIASKLTEDDVVTSLNAVRSKLNQVSNTDQECDAKYESLPSPAMSPVVLRRFGARTRHASISPKIQRAKTAALYNSPFEMNRLEELHAPATRAVTKVAIYHAVSTTQPKSSPMMSAQRLGNSSAKPVNKSQSKYDNVDDSDNDASMATTPSTQGCRTQQQRQPLISPQTGNRHQQLTRQQKVESYDSDEVEEDSSSMYPSEGTNDNHKPVIVPTFSAVFGSISPKLKRHLQEKFDEVSKDKNRGRKWTQEAPSSPKIANQYKKSSEQASDTKENQYSPPTARHCSKSVVHSVPYCQNSSNKSPSLSRYSKSPEQARYVSDRARKNSSDKVSVKERIKSINRTLSTDSNDPGFPASSPKTSPPVVPDSRGITLTRMTSYSSSSSSPVLARPGSSISVDTLSPPLSPVSGLRSRQVVAVCSPKSLRKHSTDHVVFGCAVALPCRRVAHAVPLPSGDEVTNLNTNVQHRATPSLPSSPSEQHRQRQKYAKNEKLEENTDNKLVYLKHGVLLLSEHNTREAAFRPDDNTVIEKFDDQLSYDPRPDVVTSTDPRVTKVTSTASVIDDHVNEGERTTSDEDQLSQSGIIHPRGDNLLKQTIQSFGDYDKWLDSEDSQRHDSANDKQNPVNDTHQEGNPPSRDVTETGQQFVVRRQPISKIICDIINTGSQNNSFNSREDGSTLDTTINKDGDQALGQADNMVKSTSYAEASINIADRRLQTECSVSLPASPNLRRVERDFTNRKHSKILSNSDNLVNSESGSPRKLTPFGSGSLDKMSSDSGNIMSRSTGSQTDSFTTAEKGVDIADIESSPQKPEDSPVHDSADETELLPEKLDFSQTNLKKYKIPVDSDEETEFLQSVLAFKRTDIPKKGETQSGCCKLDEVFVPPPSSPSAMNQLIEEFEEEDEDEEVQERKEIELALQKESEIREFTDKIYKRLSDLLGSQSGEGDDVDNEEDNDVFEVEIEENKEDEADDVLDDMEELISEPEEERTIRSDTCSEEDVGDAISDPVGQYGSRAVVISSKSPRTNRMKTILTIKSSSSSITTTSSSSEDEEEANIMALRNMMLQKMTFEESQLQVSRCSERVDDDSLTNIEHFYVQTRETSYSQRCPSSSREYHSDDDVARGQGLPDYYDDKPLWRRNQKPPCQLSLDMAAARRNERRERWLKKRRRNKTDIIDNKTNIHTRLDVPVVSSEQYSPNNSARARGDWEDSNWNRMTSSIHSEDFSSEMMASPKYARPILPFLSDIRSIQPKQEVVEDRIEQSYISGQQMAALSSSIQERFDEEDECREDIEKDEQSSDVYSSDNENGYDRREDFNLVKGSGKDRYEVVSDPDLDIPGIEETFNELQSVQTILEGMSERTDDTPCPTKCLPLTQENVKSMRDYYRDKYSSGRHSRMSNTDRTESDLDIFSDPPDDASSDSNRYADDEDDDDGIDTYSTTDDKVAAKSGIVSDKSRNRNNLDDHKDVDDDDNDDDDSNQADYLVGCTFYNSNAFPRDPSEGSPRPQCATTMVATNNKSPLTFSSPSGKATPTTAPGTAPSTPSTLRVPHASGSIMNSDDEFWAGSSGFEMSVRQLETAADAVSETFHAAREQMIDIQQHLQELRRQMEDLHEEDLHDAAEVSE